MRSKAFIAFLVVLLSVANSQEITPTLLLPIQTTIQSRTEYSIGFYTDVSVPHSASIQITFPFQFDPRGLINHSGCKIKRGNGNLQQTDCILANRTFTIFAEQINPEESIIITIGNILNPTDYQMSSHFVIKILFKTVSVVQNFQSGKTPFTSPPVNGGTTLTAQNHDNILIEQGSSWVFTFTPSTSYPENTTIRFIFPEGFSSSKVQCNITGISDSALRSRVFPNKHVYDCLNINGELTGSQEIIVSGIVNPNYEMTVNSIQMHILQPNNKIVLQKKVMDSSIQIKAKDMNATVLIPNKYRNNTLTYIFEINMDSNLDKNDYFQIKIDGNWTFFLEDSVFIEGINSDQQYQPFFEADYDWPVSSNLFIKNFSSVQKSSQIAFYLSVRTPLTSANYPMVISAFRSHGGLVQTYQKIIQINQTTGYIREMRMHPMVQTIKLPVGETGPLEITLGLRYNLPKTNVLTYGKFLIKITPNLPKPDVNINGVPKCYFYGDIEAKNCTYDDSDPTHTLITVFTPIDFNFQSSEIPFMVTTQGYIDPQYQGITIDTLVKRYHFHIQFYTDYREEPIPTEVIFGDWVPDSIPLTTFACDETSTSERSYDHLKCTFTTPDQDLNEPGFVHIFRLQFTGSTNDHGWSRELGHTDNKVHPNYPCIGYGPNLIADPYIKCDLITWTSGPYASDSSQAYINIYGFQLLQAGSQITLQIPKIQRHTQSYATKLIFSILEDTYGYQTDYITLYSQTIDVPQTTDLDSNNDDYEEKTLGYTLSNPIINKITDITFTDLDLLTAGITHIILQVDQTTFEDIGREHSISCGQHDCSKFNKPIQYFILYPSRTLNQVETLVFPSIVTPEKAGDYEFRMRLYKDGAYKGNWKFNITIEPQILDPPTYQFHSVQSQTVLYPHTLQYYSISFQTKNPLPSQTAYIEIIIDNHFALASDYCALITTATAFDHRGIECEVWVTEQKVIIEHMAAVTANTNFKVDLQMISVDSTATIAPTVSIYTYYQQDVLVDKIQNVQFSGTTITNTNLQTFSQLNIENPVVTHSSIRKGYFGHLILNIKPRTSDSISKGQNLLLTFTNDFYPYSNQLNLPFICKIKGVRLPCTYTINPFTVTISEINNKMSQGTDNQINITTQYLEHNGIHHPANQGRFLVTAKIYNNTYDEDTNTYTLEVYEYVEEYIDIKPNPIQYFNATFAHLDVNLHNIFTFQLRVGNDPVPAYNHLSNAGRIYIGFPTADDNSANVFNEDLGYASGLGTTIPCWFELGTGKIAALSGKQLKCKLITSPDSPYYAFVEIINFDTMPSGTQAKIIMAKIKNPSSLKIDINFLLKVNTINPTTRQQTPLYQSIYNMFFNMQNPSVALRTEADSTTMMFQPASKVGDVNKYFNTIPYSNSAFQTEDWFVIDMNTQFPLEGSVIGCLPTFYEHCIVYKEINWVAIKIGNTTLLDLQVIIDKMPTSISRVNTMYQAFTFKNRKWAETITYTITADPRWLQLRGQIVDFSFDVLGSHDKLNINQKNVDVMVTFTVNHVVNRGGCIQIQFPNNSTLVPSIKPHCRSAVTLGSALQGDPTGKPSSNIQGDVGCLVQNDYSWIITSFDQLLPGSQVKIIGKIDFPTVQTASLGMGFVVTYSDAVVNTFTDGRIIDYGTFNFPLEVNNKTWNIDAEATLYKSKPLRINSKAQLKFKLNLPQIVYKESSGGYIEISLWKYNTMGFSGGFSGPTSNIVCKILRIDNNQRFGCQVTSASGSSTNYYYYRLQTQQNLPANNDFQITLTTQNGNANQGINFPSNTGSYQIDITIKYSSGSSNQVSQPQYIEVYGPDFSILNFISTVDIPDEPNMILIQFKPSNTISTNQQLIIEIPTVGIDNSLMFQDDLGMGYSDYDDLKFDLFESSISSMDCKVYKGDSTNHQPVKIVCSNFNTDITSSMLNKIGFWVRNPSTNVGLAIPVQIYSYDTYRARKDCWSIVESAIRVLPTSSTPISDLGNFATGSTYRQINNQHFSFTTRNSQNMNQNDLYIMKFNFDLRKEQSFAGKFNYNSGLTHIGDVIFMQNCQTIILRVGANDLTLTSSGSLTINARITGIFYNPPTILSSSQKIITAYAIYLQTRKCDKILHNDQFPDLVPRQMSNPSFSLVNVHGNNYKGQSQDYKISFTYSTSSTDNDMSLVKKISIQFPPFITYDMKFENDECIEDISSQIQIKDCYIDTTTYTIWLTPITKSYQNNHNFKIETKGYSIINPSTSPSINLNKFTIRYYTWQSQNQPVLIAQNDDYVFFKADQTNIPSSTISFSGTDYGKHDYLGVPHEVYVNQFVPSSSYLSTNQMKTPLEFVFKVTSTFSDLSSSNSNYHVIKVQFNSYYSHQSINQKINDLYYYVPTCHLNGVRIHNCQISSGKIQVRFQQQLILGSEAALRFSVLNPKDASDDGFFITNLANSHITLPVQFFPYGQTQYYSEAEPFQSYYRIASSYPELGIYEATVDVGTKVYGKLNYLDFYLKFSRNDINGLVLEIPVVRKDGTIIYSSTSLMGLPSGSDYPCSVGINTDVYCYYEQGTSSGFGRPTRIYISKFSIQAGNTLSLRILFTNPDNIGVYPNFIFKAFGGTFSPPQIMGNQFMGEYQIIDPFQTLPEFGYYSTDSCTAQPNRGLWNRQTNYKFFIDHTQPTQSYVILKWRLNHPTYGEISEYQLVNSQIVDYFTISDTPDNRHIYLVKKLGSAFTGSSSSYHTFGYLRSKHFLHNSHEVFLLKKPGFSIITCSVSQSWLKTNYIVNQYGTASIQYLDLGDRYINQNTWQYLSIDIGTAKNMLLHDDDPADFVVAIKFFQNRPFNYFVSATECSIEYGVTSTDPLKPVTCQLQNTNYQIILRNVNKFLGDYIKVYYLVRNWSGTVQGAKVQVRAYANSQVYQLSDGWALFTSSTAAYNTYQIYYTAGNRNYQQNSNAHSAPTYNSQLFSSQWVDHDGHARVVSVTGNQAVVVLRKGSAISFSGSNVYQIYFRFYMQRFSFSSCTSVSISGSGSHPGMHSCGASNKHFWVRYSYYHNGYFEWPSWTYTQQLTFTFNFGSVTGDIGTIPDYKWYVSASVTYYKSVYYHQYQPKCGCSLGYRSTCCSGCWHSSCCSRYACNYGCITNYSCRWYYGIDTFVLTTRGGGYVQQDNRNLASSTSMDILSASKYAQTQLSITINSINYNVGPSQGSYLLFHLHGLIFQGGDPFPDARGQDIGAYIDCKCVVGSISISATTSYQEPKCVRYLPVGMDASIGVFTDVTNGQSLRCFFPGFINPVSGYGSTNQVKIDTFLKYHHYFHRYYNPRTYFSPYARYNAVKTLNTRSTSGTNNFVQNSYWSSSRESYSSSYYDINMTGNYLTDPIIYMSMYAPKPLSSFCSSGYHFCRAYTSFINRRFYLTAQRNAYTNQIRFSGTAQYPPSDDIYSSYYRTYMAWCHPTSDYYVYRRMWTRNTGVLSPSTPAYNYNPSLFGSNLHTLPSGFLISVNMNGRTLYSYKRNYGQYQGSFIKLIMSGFSTLFGCGATLHDRVRSFDSPFYCKVISSNQLHIKARKDISMTGYLYITLYTSSVPSSVNYKLYLYDKYQSSSQYGLSVYVSQSFGRTMSGYQIRQPTQILWRKQVYKEYRVADGPIRFTFKNNYQYVYDQQTTSNSDGISVYYPGGISNSDNYICYLKQYLPQKKHFRRQYTVNCHYESSNTIRISSIPHHVLEPDYYYEVVIYRNKNGVDGFITLSTSDFNTIHFTTRSSTSTADSSIVNRDTFRRQRYRKVYPINLNHIYFLTKQAGATNSLFIQYTLSQSGSGFHYFQFQFDNLGLSNFEIEDGEQIPCSLYGAFSSISGSSIDPICKGFAPGIDKDSPLVIRVLNIDSFSASSTFRISFDNFNNPAYQKLFLTPINVKISYINRANNDIWTSYFPSIFVSDSIDTAIPSVLSGGFFMTNDDRGVSNTHYTSISWPYSSNYNDISEKIVMKIQGGITCCQNYANFVLDDNRTSSNTLVQLWKNTVVNITVYRTPTLSAASTLLYIRNVINPYPIQKETYEEIKKIQILFYNDYKHRYLKQIDQFNYSQYDQLSQINVANDFILRSQKRAYDYHQNYPMTYDISYSFTKNSFPNRKLKQTVLVFTAGVKSIERAEIRYSVSPFIVNNVLSVTIFKNSDNYWCLKISGMDQNLYSTSQYWYIRMRFYPNSNNLNYQSSTYAANGQLQFRNSQTQSLYNDNYNSSAYAPNKFELFQQRYVHGFYQLQRNYMYADSGLQTNRLVFRFTSPYNITESQSFDIKLNNPTDFVPNVLNGQFTCIIQKTISSKTILGSGLFSPCSYSSTNNIYSIGAPKGGLLQLEEYTVSILQFDQLSSSFSMPTQPNYYELSFIYNSQLLLQFGDVISLQFMGRMRQLSVNHRTLIQSARNFIGFTFEPDFNLQASSLSSPITESVLQIEFQSKYFDDCLGIDDIFANDGMIFQSGAYYSHYSNPAVPNSNTRILCGQYSESYTPIKLRITDYGNINAGSSYYFRFPLILNPAGTSIPMIYKIKLLEYENSKYHPKVISYYQYNNLQHTVSGTTGWQYIRLDQDSNDIVQNNLGISVIYNTYRPPLNSQVIAKFKNNAIKAFTSLSALTSLSNSNYGHYQFYPNINLCLFKKTTNTNDGSLSLGIHPTSIDRQSYVISYVHTYHSQSVLYTSNFNIGSQDGSHGSGGSVSATIRNYGSWSQSSITKISGVTRTNSVGVYQISFKSNVLEFPEGSYMKITLDSQFSIEKDQCKQLNGFLPGTTKETSNLVCRKESSNILRIAGYNHISQGTALSVTLYLQIAYNSLNSRSPNAQIIVYSEQGNTIIDADTASISLPLNNVGHGSYDLSLSHIQDRQLQKDTAIQFDISFKLASHTLTTGSYVLIDFGNWTIDPATTQGQVIWKYKVGNNIYWVPSEVTNPSDNIYRIPVYSNYQMTTGQQITIRVRHQLPDSQYGIFFPNDQWNYVKIEAFNPSDTRLQHQYKRIWIQPYMHTSLEVTPILKYVEAVTMYQFKFTPNVSASVGDLISIQFTTTDGLKEQLFNNTLGKTISQNESTVISCHQSDHLNIISDSRIECQLFGGDNDATNPVPAVIQIPVKKDIAANTEIKITVLNIQNPIQDNYPVGITVKLMNYCVNSDLNNPCTYYKSIDYIYFDTTPSAVSIGTHGQLTFDSDLVSATNTQHTFTGSYTVNTGDYLKIVYFPQVTVPETCTITSANGICYSYPLQNTILIKATATQTSSYSFTLGGMTNLYRTRKTAYDPYTQIWNANTGTIRARFETDDFNTTHITQDPITGNTLQFTFTPTLTPDYELKYGFNNIAKIQISHLIQNEYIQMIFIQAGDEITFEGSYCNATLQSDTSQAIPYPIRFQCIQIGSNTLKLIKQDDFPQWTSSYTAKNIVLYLKYRIDDDKTGFSDPWNARAYTIDSVDGDYLVSQATGTFPIIDYKSPFIYKINFPTQAFNKRTCRTNELCMFYGYLLPSTPQTPVSIEYMTYKIPEQFGYSNQVDYDCLLQQKNDDFNPITCSAARYDSDVIISFVPDSYNHNYKLVTIDSADKTMLFKAPEYPGTHYQMKVDLYAGNHNLMESMMVNLTTVYGELLQYPEIYITIPLDAQSYGLFEFKFKVGSEDILPSFENNANNRITSAIQFQFSKSFEDDLGTGKYAGEQVACLPISGLTVLSTNKLTCKIYPSVSTITYPKIIVTGYDRIQNGTDVIIRIAQLKTLPASIDDYIKIGVSLTYYDYGGVKGYIYEPTGYVVGGTSLTAAAVPITLTVTQSSSNYVGQLVNYTFTGSLGAGFATITTDDYIAVQFQQNVFEGVFDQNLQAICSIAASGKCDSYGLSGIIYFKPASDITSSSLVFNINNMINSAFSFEYVNITFKVFTIVDHKVNAEGEASIIKFSKPSGNISALLTKIDSIYGGDSEINYDFEFQMNHYLPIDGMIIIEIPPVYQSLFQLNSVCLLDKAFGSLTACDIIDSHLFVIRANGNLLSPEFTYQITITNITNPNQKLNNQNFLITSSFNDDVYSPKIISINSFNGPQISVVTVKSCETFDVSLSAYNSFVQVSYKMSLICANYIKEASQIRFYLVWNPNQKLGTCSSLTNSLYSYQCEIKKEIKNNKQQTYLNMYLQGISPQQLITLQALIKNGQMGTYQIRAEVSYKGFTYLSTTSNQFFIKSEAVQLIQNADIQFNYYPINRNFDSIHTVKIPSPPQQATGMVIYLPDEVRAAEEKIISCFVLSQNFVESYINLLKQDLQFIPIQCSLTNRMIQVNGLNGVISQLGNEDFLRIAIFRLKNPNISSIASTYRLSFMNSETGKGAIISTGSINSSFRISNPPLNTQINDISLMSSKFLVKTDYHIKVSTVNGNDINLNEQSQIAVIISFPEQYQEILERIQTPPEIIITFGTDQYKQVSYLSGLKLIAEYQILASVSFSELKLQFQFVNPAVSVVCNSQNIYTVSLLNIRYNSLISQTLANNVECPVLDDRLFVVNVTGKNRMEQGSVQQYTISIEKPAKFLNITPVLTTPAINVQPKSIIFRGYRQTVKTFKLKISNSYKGEVNMRFLKIQQDETFYNDIPSQNLTVVLSDKNYSITFVQINSKSVGIPIQLFINLQVENSRQFTLLYSHNCSDNYIFNPDSFLNIDSGTQETSITIQYTGNKIPEMCTIIFEISSLTENRYYLPINKFYISAAKSIERSSNTATMRLRITQQKLQSEDVGYTVYTGSSSEIPPEFYSLNETNVMANSANFSCSVSDNGTVYFAVFKIGTNRNKVTAEQIYAQNLSTAITYGSSRTYTTNTISTINANLTAIGLQSQTSYMIGAYLNSSIGNSDLMFEVFHTDKASNGAAIKIQFTSIYSNEQMIQALKKVLRIEQTRIAVLTITSVLNQISDEYVSDLMNSRSFIVEFIIGPDPLDDSTPPIDILNQFKDSQSQKNDLKQFLPNFVSSYDMTTREIILSKPKFRDEGASILAATHQSVKIRAITWQQANITAVIVKQPTQNLLAAQVSGGYDQDNNVLDQQHYHFGITNLEGEIQFEFTLLSSNTQYAVFVSAKSIVPFATTLSIQDSQVIRLNVTTSVNFNAIGSDQSIVEALEEKNPELAASVAQQIKNVINKKSVAPQDSQTVYRNGRKTRRVKKQSK